jgi:hypothetical protein
MLRDAERRAKQHRSRTVLAHFHISQTERQLALDVAELLDHVVELEAELAKAKRELEANS